MLSSTRDRRCRLASCSRSCRSSSRVPSKRGLLDYSRFGRWKWHPEPGGRHDSGVSNRTRDLWLLRPPLLPADLRRHRDCPGDRELERYRHGEAANCLRASVQAQSLARTSSGHSLRVICTSKKSRRKWATTRKAHFIRRSSERSVSRQACTDKHERSRSRGCWLERRVLLDAKACIAGRWRIPYLTADDNALNSEAFESLVVRPAPRLTSISPRCRPSRSSFTYFNMTLI